MTLEMSKRNVNKKIPIWTYTKLVIHVHGAQWIAWRIAKQAYHQGRQEISTPSKEADVGW